MFQLYQVVEITPNTHSGSRTAAITACSQKHPVQFRRVAITTFLAITARVVSHLSAYVHGVVSFFLDTTSHECTMRQCTRASARLADPLRLPDRRRLTREVLCNFCLGELVPELSLSSSSSTRFLQGGTSTCRPPGVSLIPSVMNEWYENGILMVGMASSRSSTESSLGVRLKLTDRNPAIESIRSVQPFRHGVQALEEPGSIFLTTHLTTNHFERGFQARTRSHNKRDSNSRSERKSITSSRFAVDGSLVCLVSHLITCHPVSHITTQSCFLRNFTESSQPVTM